jgi:hypothetical protein
VDLDAWMMDKFPFDLGKGLKEKAKVSISPFVILHHTGHISLDRGEHWDWLIQFPEYFLAELTPRMQACKREQIRGLLTFASETDPIRWSRETSFWRLPPHRLLYLDYQGAVSGERGAVKRIASGQLEWIFLGDFRIEFRLLRLGWMEDRQVSGWLTPAEDQGASTNSPAGQYSLALDLENLTRIEGPASRAPLPWTADIADPGPLWRFS